MPKVLIPLAQSCEELEAVTLIDLLRRAEFEVITAGLSDEPITASRGVRLIPDTTIDAIIESKQSDSFDLIVLPGGLPGADYLNEDPRIQALLKAQAQSNKYIGAICAAPKVLASSGLLENKRATAYPGALEGLDLSNIDLTTENTVIDGKVMTSRGPGTAMDFALTIIEELAGKAKRDSVEAGLVR